MKCITCTDIHLEIVSLAEGPRAIECPSCNGHWITNYDYWRWHGKLDKELPNQDCELDVTLSEPGGPRRCPDCKVFIAKYRVGHGTQFHIERCGSCGGMWFDGKEWEALKARNLHDDIHRVFGQPWQIAVREAQKNEVVETRMRELLGDEKYTEVNQLKRWLKQDKQRSVILQYLSSQ